VIQALSFDLSVPFPASLVLSPRSLIKYQLLSRHMLSLRYVSHRLQSCWLVLRALSKTASASSRLVYATLSSMGRWISGLQYHAAVEVLEPAWERMETRLREAKNVQGVWQAHGDFLDECLKGCMLTQPVLLKVFFLFSFCPVFCCSFCLTMKLSSDSSSAPLIFLTKMIST
jgi:gamma-tubulin complex component 2